MAVDHPDRLSYMMSFVKIHEYPLVHSMSTEEIIAIFNKNNRPYLVYWALTLLNKDCYDTVLAGAVAEQDNTLLADLVYSHGFCTDKQRLGFLGGELPLEVQLDILFKIFTFIDSQKQANNCQEPNNLPPVTLEDLSSLMNADINIFPSFGQIKTLTDTDRDEKLNQIQLKIQEMASKQDKLTDNSNLQHVDKDHMSNILENMQDNLSKLERVVSNVVRETSVKTEPNYKIEPQFAELLENCNKDLKIVAQYIDDLETLSDAKIEEVQLPANQLLPSIESLAGQMMGLFGKTETLKYFYY